MSDSPKYTMTLSLQVLEHLGMNLYSNIPAVLSEVVANAYDADANEVIITISEDKIIIQDDGNGMNLQEINSKFLRIGYQKRNDGVNGSISPKYYRNVMGRKGIGKLSLFSIANNIEIHTIKDGVKNGLILNREKIKDSISGKNADISKSEAYHPTEIAIDSFEIEKGTRITITQLDKNVNRTEHFLRRRLARRFSIIDEKVLQDEDTENNTTYPVEIKKDIFNVKINDKYISIEDRDYFNKVQFLWLIGEHADIYSPKFKNIKEVKKLNGEVKSRDENEYPNFKISGWIATVEKPSDLGDDSNDSNKLLSNNKISILTRGKLAQEDILKSLRNCKVIGFI